MTYTLTQSLANRHAQDAQHIQKHVLDTTCQGNGRGEDMGTDGGDSGGAAGRVGSLSACRPRNKRRQESLGDGASALALGLALVLTCPLVLGVVATLALALALALGGEHAGVEANEESGDGASSSVTGDEGRVHKAMADVVVFFFFSRKEFRCASSRNALRAASPGDKGGRCRALRSASSGDKGGRGRICKTHMEGSGPDNQTASRPTSTSDAASTESSMREIEEAEHAEDEEKEEEEEEVSNEALGLPKA